MLEIPLSAVELRLGEVGLAFAVFQILSNIVVEQRYVCRGDSRALRIVFGALAQRVQIGAGEAGVEPAGGQVLVFLQGFLKLPAVDAEVGPQQVRDSQASVFVQLFGDGLLFLGGNVCALGERMGVRAHGIFFDVFKERFQGSGLLGQFLVVPGRGGVGGQCLRIRQVHAGIAA